MVADWVERIKNIKSDIQFNQLALEAFRFQLVNIPVYAEYCKNLDIDRGKIDHFTKVPFLPISFFKSHSVIIKDKQPELTFTSSGSTGMQTSSHQVADVTIYEASFRAGFRFFYGRPNDYHILALLPSYLERQGSSLVYMAEHLIRESQSPHSGFYLNNYKELAEKLKYLLHQNDRKILLLGVTYALLNLSEQFPMDLANTVIMETGGMKGQRRELVREELHHILTSAFKAESVHSEYGMTELLSQGYSKGNGKFQTPPWLKILIRDAYDPFALLGYDRSGGINVIDLANINSCCFIETADLGKNFDDGSFTILGRFDNSDIRGCNLLV
jgi:phenylacetate-coenzyme A ligase PaaK-like adenylate-forming protein